MKNILKKIILVSILFIGIANSVCAQDKYEYGVVGYKYKTGYKYLLTTSLSSLYTEEIGNTGEGDFFNNFSPVNKVLATLSEKGWEVYCVNEIPNGTNYFLKRKL